MHQKYLIRPTHPPLLPKLEASNPGTHAPLKTRFFFLGGGGGGVSLRCDKLVWTKTLKYVRIYVCYRCPACSAPIKHNSADHLTPPTGPRSRPSPWILCSTARPTWAQQPFVLTSYSFWLTKTLNDLLSTVLLKIQARNVCRALPRSRKTFT